MWETNIAPVTMVKMFWGDWNVSLIICMTDNVCRKLDVCFFFCHLFIPKLTGKMPGQRNPLCTQYMCFQRNHWKCRQKWGWKEWLRFRRQNLVKVLHFKITAGFLRIMPGMSATIWSLGLEAPDSSVLNMVNKLECFWKLVCSVLCVFAFTLYIYFSWLDNRKFFFLKIC